MPGTKQTIFARVARQGCATIIALDAIKRATAGTWDAMHTTVRQAMEAALRAKLKPTDIFLPIDDLTWLVVMPETGPREALTSCLRVAYDLHRSILNNCRLEDLDVEYAAAIGDDLLQLRTPPHEELLAAAKLAGIACDEAAPAAAPAAAPPPQTKKEPADAAHFQPIWDSQSQAIGAYHCRGNGTGTSHPDQLADTLSALKAAVELLERRLYAGERNLFVAPVPYAVLCSPTARMEYLSVCRQLHCQMRPHLLLNVEGIDIYVTQRRLGEIVAAIQPFARAVFATVPLRAPSLTMYKEAGFKGLGLALPDLLTGQVPGEIVRLCDSAQRMHLMSFLSNLATDKLFEYALSLGVNWISGPVVGPAVTDPVPPYRLAKEALLRNFVNQPEKVAAAV